MANNWTQEFFTKPQMTVYAKISVEFRGAK